MGAGASSIPDLVDEATAKTLAGDKYDQAKFDELKNAEGFITKDQFTALIPDEAPAAAAEAAPAEAAPAAAEVAPAAAAGGGKVEIDLVDLKKAVDAAKEKKLTPMVIDASEAHGADTFFSYDSASVLDAKQVRAKLRRDLSRSKHALP